MDQFRRSEETFFVRINLLESMRIFKYLGRAAKRLYDDWPQPCGKIVNKRILWMIFGNKMLREGVDDKTSILI